MYAEVNKETVCMYKNMHPSSSNADNNVFDWLTGYIALLNKEKSKQRVKKRLKEVLILGQKCLGYTDHNWYTYTTSVKHPNGMLLHLKWSQGFEPAATVSIRPA